MDEVIDAVRKLKKGKSPGSDNIPAELVTNAGDISLLCKIVEANYCGRFAQKYGTKENGQNVGPNP